MEKLGKVLTYFVIVCSPYLVFGEVSKSDLAKVREIIGEKNAYVLDMYRDEPAYNQYLRTFLNSESSRELTVREKAPNYSKLRQRYLSEGIRLNFKGFSTPKLKAARAPASVQGKEKLAYKLPQFLGLTFFKRSDLSLMCDRVVEKAIALGAEGVALFYPVHFSGGNSKTFSMPKNPIYGKDYFYETAQAPDQKEFFRCVDKILESNLKINYVPHLESISSLSSSGESEWRMYSGIPLDQYYYYYSFSPILEYLRSSKSRAKLSERLLVTFAAEIDNMVMGHPAMANKIVQNLRSDLKSFSKKKIPIMLNTNGDFYHLWKIPQANPEDISCKELGNLFDAIDYVSPSMYGDKGHFSEEKNKLNISSTLSQFYKSFDESIPQRCRYITKKFKKLKIGFGEFALDPDKNHHYGDILDKPSVVEFVYYWNHSKWDHLMVHPGEKKSSIHRLRKQLISK